MTNISDFYTTDYLWGSFHATIVVNGLQQINPWSVGGMD